MKMRGTGSRSHDLVKHDILAVDGENATQNVGGGEQMPFEYPGQPHSKLRGASVLHQAEAGPSDCRPGSCITDVQT